MKDGKETTKLRHIVNNLLGGISSFQRTILIIKLFGWLVSYRVSRLSHSKPRARIHWVGHVRRSRWPDRLLFAFLIPVAMAVLSTEEYLIWSIGWGLFFSLFLNFYTVLRLASMKQ